MTKSSNPESYRECFLGIDTSNYTTSLSVCDFTGKVLTNWKRMLPVKENERGLRQSDAVFHHVRNVPEMMPELNRFLEEEGYRPVAVGYSSAPRPNEDSYMPCFLVGKSVAVSIASALHILSFDFSHQEGHIEAAAYSSGFSLEKGDFIAFHVSGGTTDIVLVRPGNDRFVIERVGGTVDANAGQIIDRIGVRMGLQFPCGREMEQLALECKETVPEGKTSVHGLDCNLSGLENLACELWDKTRDKGTVSRFVFGTLARVLSRLTGEVRKVHPELPIVFSGGVMSNSIICGAIRKDYSNVFFAEPAFSSDNAAGIALLTRNAFLKIET